MSLILAITSHILTILIFCLAFPILILTSTYAAWASTRTSMLPTLLVSSNLSDPQAQNYTILAVPHSFNSYGYIANIYAGALGTLDALLMLVCLGAIDCIYLRGRTHLAKVAKVSAARGEAPAWLWGVAIAITIISVAMTLWGFELALLARQSSAKFVLPFSGDIQTDVRGAYIAPDGKGFSIAGWACQVRDHLVDGMEYAGTLRSFCGQDRATTSMTLALAVAYSVLLLVLVLRFVGEMIRVRRGAGVVVKKDKISRSTGPTPAGTVAAETIPAEIVPAEPVPAHATVVQARPGKHDPPRSSRKHRYLSESPPDYTP